LGIFGSFYFPLNFPILYRKEEKKLWFCNSSDKKSGFCNLSYILMIQASLGVLIGFRKQLNVVGIGYQVEIKESSVLVLKLGFSHSISVKVPSSLVVTCPKPRILVITGIDLQKVSNFASIIRRLKLPSAYKEKGIYLSGENSPIKQGKKT